MQEEMFLMMGMFYVTDATQEDIKLRGMQNPLPPPTPLNNLLGLHLWLRHLDLD